VNKYLIVEEDGDEDFHGEAAARVHSVTANGVVAPREYVQTMPGVIVDADNYEDTLRDVVDRFCDLNWILVDATQTDLEARGGAAVAFKIVECPLAAWALNPQAVETLESLALGGFYAGSWGAPGTQKTFRYDNSGEFVPASGFEGLTYGEYTTFDLGPRSRICGFTDSHVYTSRVGEVANHYAWNYAVENTRGKVACDLRAFISSEECVPFRWWDEYTILDGVQTDSARHNKWQKWDVACSANQQWKSDWVSEVLNVVPPASGYQLEGEYTWACIDETKPNMVIPSAHARFDLRYQLVRVNKRDKWTYQP
jgi:hypothetical protein